MQNASAIHCTSSMISLPHKIDLDLTAWVENHELHRMYKSIRLAQGAPSVQAPAFLIDSLSKVVHGSRVHQYCPSQGAPTLLKNVASFFSPYFARELTSQNILISLGAIQGITLGMQALVKEDSEVVVLEPCFSQYIYRIEQAGGKAVGVPLDLVEKEGKLSWYLDLNKLRDALSQKTSMILLNHPHNPTGKCFTKTELEGISKVLEQFPHVWILSDDVYFHLPFEGFQYNSIATIGSNWKKTLSVFSGGKLFSATGWKLGFCICPAQIQRELEILQGALLITQDSVGQYAMAQALTHLNKPYQDCKNFMDYTLKLFSKSQHRLIDIIENSWLNEAGVKVISAESGYFLFADVECFRGKVPEKYFSNALATENSLNLRIFKDNKVPFDYAVCRWLAAQKGFIPMPGSMFYLPGSPNYQDHFIRISFCKEPKEFDELQAALKSS